MTPLPLPSRYATSTHRLALGLEPIDAARGARVAHPLLVTLEGEPRARGARARVERHPSCLHVLRYAAGLGAQADLRLVEPGRRFVPRRLRVPLPDLDGGGNPPLAERVRRPALFPGAAYDLPEATTALRGRVTRAGAPLRWARVVATRPGTSVVVGRAAGDDRGEFLLLLAPDAMPLGDLVSPLPIQVTAFAPAATPVPPTPETPGLDGLWDLPLEVLPAPGAADAVSPGETLPPGYTATAGRVVDFLPGRTLGHEVSEFVIP